MHRRQILSTQFVRTILVCTSAFLASVQAIRAAADSPPYQARVVAAGAAVHSGPGESFYPTDTLAQGDLVDVYKEKPGGWLAIRPPVNSFSWVAERELNLKDGGLAEIAQDGVASRIGSRLNDRHNASQVRLKKGEVVEVVGEDNIRGEKWFKIAPPAGEFRWIQASLIERIGPIPNSSDSPPPASKQDAATDITPVSASSPVSPSAPPLMPTAAAPQKTNTLPSTSIPTPATNAASPVASSNMASSGPVASDFSHDLSAIELRLSRMVAAPTNLWNTERLERDTAQLMARAKTPAERDAVRVTQEKINHFAAIGHRHNNSAEMSARGSALASTGANQPQATGPQSSTSNPQSPYDAVGILRPVVSRRPGAPQFALVDDRGQVVSFVTPTPDLNLQPYLGHRVGVTGNRDFIQEFQRTNVTAARVTPLNDRLLR